MWLELEIVCDALVHFHQCGYVHGDVKPRNILRHPGHSRAWKMIDLDASVKIGEKTGFKMSTGFVPPEMIEMENEDKDHSGTIKTSSVVVKKSFDVWSFGMTMYSLVTGQSFFHCDGRDNLVHLEELAHLTDDMIHHRLEVVSDVNARVLLSSILKIDPKDRLTLPFMVTGGKVAISSTPSNQSQEERFKLEIPVHQSYHLYMRAPPGVHDAKYHSVVDICEDESTLWV